MEPDKIQSKAAEQQSSLLAELLQMGFPESKIHDALRRTTNRQQAIDTLLAGEGSGDKKQLEEDFQDEQEDYKMIFVVRMDLKLPLSKIAECVATAALKAYKQIEAFVDVDDIKEYAFFQWSQNGQKKIVVKSPTEKELLQLIQKAKEHNINFALVHENPSHFKMDKAPMLQVKKNLKKQLPEQIEKEGYKKIIQEGKIQSPKLQQTKKSIQNLLQTEILVLGAFGPASESQLDPLTRHFKLL